VLRMFQSSRPSTSAASVVTGYDLSGSLSNLPPEEVFPPTPRPPNSTLSRLLKRSREKHEPDQGVLTVFEKKCAQVKQHTTSSHDFVVQTFYDGDMVSSGRGGGHTIILDETPMQMIFIFYAARQSVSETGMNADPTFQDIERANSTMSAGEFSKFVNDMIPVIIPRSDLTAIFQLSNNTVNSADEDNGNQELCYDEFTLALTRLALYLYHHSGCSVQSALHKLADTLKFNQPYAVREYLRITGRMNAGFGAWRPSPEARESAQFHEGKKHRFSRKNQSLVEIFPNQDVLQGLSQDLEKLGKKAKGVNWAQFPGPYIGIVLPQSRTEAKRCRFKITVQNMSSGPCLVAQQTSNLSMMTFKYLPTKRVAAGMEYELNMWVELPCEPSEQLGEVMLYEYETGREIACVPVYVKVLPEKMNEVENVLLQRLKEKFGSSSEKLEEAFVMLDGDRSGSITRAEFREGLQKLDLNLNRDQTQALVWRMDKDGDGTINYEEFVTRVREFLDPSLKKPDEQSSFKFSDIAFIGSVGNLDKTSIQSLQDGRGVTLIPQCYKFPAERRGRNSPDRTQKTADSTTTPPTTSYQ